MKGLALIALAGVSLAGCVSDGGTAGKEGGVPLRGGTAYFAEQPLTTPTYIFPLISGQYYTGANTSELQTLLYLPLYWYGDGGNTAIDYRLSIGNPPVYSDGNRVVTITLKHYVWSDGETVSARDVGFWINLLKASKAHWANYVPGGFPDNVVSWQAVGPATIRLRLNSGYNPFWFTYNELSQITPLPLAWDRTSLSQPAPSSSAANLPDTTPAGAREVFGFLNGQATKVSGYASSPIWSVVDAPWRLISLTSDGTATFVPNRRYGGPLKPRLAKFVELPFTSAAAEFSVLRAGSAIGGPGTSGEQLSVGYVPDNDVPQQPVLRAQGYQLVKAIPFGFDYFEPNFNNPVVGPILRQLYFRQAFQHLVDQPGWIRAYYEGLGVPTYSPVPAQPANPYADAKASVNPYPFSVPGGQGAARRPWLADRPRGSEHVCPARDRGGPVRHGHQGGPAAQVHPHVSQRAPLHRWLHGGSAVGGPAGRHPDLPGHGDLRHHCPDDRALRVVQPRLLVAAGPVRCRLALSARPLPQRRRDLPDRRARQRQQLLQPRGRQAHRHDEVRPVQRYPGGAQRLRRPGQAAAAGFLAAKPGHHAGRPGQSPRVHAQRLRLHQPRGVVFHESTGLTWRDT